LLQESFKTKEELLKLKLARTYRTVAATDGIKTRKTHRRGCAILIDSNLNVTALKERSKNNVEMIGVKVTGNSNATFKNPFELWTAYSGPYKKDALKCKQILKNLEKERGNRILLVGDLNSDFSPNGSEVCKAIKEELESMEEKGKANILNNYDEPTTSNKNGSIIDIAVTMGEWDLGFAYPFNWDLSSVHYPICIGINTMESKKQNKRLENPPQFRFTNDTIKQIKSGCEKLLKEKDQHNSESLANSIINLMQCAKTKQKRKQNKKHKQWWNEEINMLFEQKQTHLSKFGKDKQFKDIEDKLQNAISKAKNESFQKFASSLNHTNRNSDVYRAVKNIGIRRSSKVAELSLKSKDGTITLNIHEKVNLLSRRYQVPLGHHPNISQERKQSLREKRKLQEANSTPGQNHEPFTLQETLTACAGMSNNKAPGLSRLKKEDLEMGGECMDLLITELANKIALSGVWPDFLKSAIICPLPKDGGKLDIIGEEETRPISLLEVIDKWVQKIFYNRMIHHVKFHETQAGFCLSCDHHTSLVTVLVMTMLTQ